jgi:aerobic-type carbon monoxide dehydrogenase small subunit (CoxS/CutS family)
MEVIKKSTITLTVNDETYDVSTAPHRTLLEVLREDLQFTGAKESCGEGVCGSCTVLIDGLPVRSCLTLAAAVEGKSITTIEGLARGDRLHPVQEAFVTHHAIQCGFCSPGMILTAVALLQENPRPTEEEIRRALSGNICRCTGYAKIVEAVQSLAGEGR